MTMPLLIKNRNQQLYSDALSSVWMWWDMVTDPSYALQNELDIWEILQRDPKCYMGIQQRLSDVAGPRWRVFPFNNSKKKADKLVAGIFEDALRRVPSFADFRRRLAQAVFRGKSWEAILGRRELLSLGDTPPQMWWVPTGFQHIDPRRLIVRPMQDRKADGTIRVRGEWWMAVIPHLQFNQPGLWQGRYAKVQHPEHYVRVTYDNEESRLGHGRGIIDVLYFYHWAKQIVVREGLQGLERWAHGMVVAKLDSQKSGSQTAEQVRDAALEKLRIMRSKHIIAVDKDDEIEVHNSAEDGNLVMNWLNYIDSCIMGVCTGASVKSANDVGAAGSYASDKVGENVQAGVVQYDINKIDENITTDVGSLWMKLNRPQLAMTGALMGVPMLEDANRPEFKTVQEKAPDYEEGMTRLSAAMQIPNFAVRKDEAYEQTGYTQPEEGDDVLVGQAPPDPMGMPGEELPPDEGGDPESAAGPEDDDSLFDDAEARPAEASSEIERPDMEGDRKGQFAEDLDLGFEALAERPQEAFTQDDSEADLNHEEAMVSGREPALEPKLRNGFELFREREKQEADVNAEQMAVLLKAINERPAAPSAPTVTVVNDFGESVKEAMTEAVRGALQFRDEFTPHITVVVPEQKPADVHVHNEVAVPDVTVNNQVDVKPTPVQVEVTNEVKAPQVNIKNEVTVPEVKVPDVKVEFKVPVKKSTTQEYVRKDGVITSSKTSHEYEKD